MWTPTRTLEVVARRDVVWCMRYYYFFITKDPADQSIVVMPQLAKWRIFEANVSRRGIF